MLAVAADSRVGIVTRGRRPTLRLAAATDLGLLKSWVQLDLDNIEITSLVQLDTDKM